MVIYIAINTQAENKKIATANVTGGKQSADAFRGMPKRVDDISKIPEAPPKQLPKEDKQVPKSEPPPIPEPKAPIPTKTGRELAVRVNTVGDRWPHIHDKNLGLKDVTAYADGNTLTISFTFDIKAVKTIGGRASALHSMLVRAFDRDGGYVTHFITAEKFIIASGSLGLAVQVLGEKMLTFHYNVPRHLLDITTSIE